MKILIRRKIGCGGDEEIDTDNLRGILFQVGGNKDREIEVKVRGNRLVIDAWACGLIVKPVASNQIEMWRDDED